MSKFLLSFFENPAPIARKLIILIICLSASYFYLNFLANTPFPNAHPLDSISSVMNLYLEAGEWIYSFGIKHALQLLYYFLVPCILLIVSILIAKEKGKAWKILIILGTGSAVSGQLLYIFNQNNYAYILLWVSFAIFSISSLINY